MKSRLCSAFVVVCGLMAANSLPSLAGGVDIRSYGHSSLLIKGGRHSVLINPFRAVGCASRLKEPRVRVKVILASSELADEGAKVARGKFLVKPGSYRIRGLNLEGFSSPHDRLGGRRFGQATLWQWRQAGLSFAHLGGAVGSLTAEDKVLLGRPDVLIIAVGGGAKVYKGTEAAAIVRQLQPKIIIPVHYVRGKPPKGCDLDGVQPFLEAMKDIPVKNVGKTLYVPSQIKEKSVIKIMH